MVGVDAPAGASVQSVAPASATVAPGGAASATVRVEADAVVCLQVSQPHSTISASVDKECDAGTWSTGLQVRSRGDTPDGTYTLSVSDGESSRTFTLRVQAPPPSTTTTAKATTTVPRPTTTPTVPPTTAPPATQPPTTVPATTAPTTAPPSATPTTAPLGPGELRGEPFATISALVDAGAPDDAMFIPLPAEAFADCLPLDGPCADLSSELVLVPARTHAVRWSAVDGTAGQPLPSLLATRGLESLQVVGAEPPAAEAATFSLAVLDLATGEGGSVRSFEARLDDQRRLVPADDDRDGSTVLAATLDPPVTVIERSTSRSPFGRPYRVTTRRLTEASPVLVAHGSAAPQVLYALRAPEGWGFSLHAVPLLGAGRVPFLARGVDGPPGLVVPIPAAITAELRAGPAASTQRDPTDDETAEPGVPVWLVIAVAVGAAGVGTVAFAVRRRRRWRL